MSRFLFAVSVVTAAVLVLAPVAMASVPECELTVVGKGGLSGAPGNRECWVSCPGTGHSPTESVNWNIWVYDETGAPIQGFTGARVHIASYPDSVKLCAEETGNTDLPYIYPVGPSDPAGMVTFLFRGSIHCTSDLCFVAIIGCTPIWPVWIHSVDLNLDGNPSGSGGDSVILSDVLNFGLPLPGNWSGKTGYKVYTGFDNCVDDNCGGGDATIWYNHLDHTCTVIP